MDINPWSILSASALLQFIDDLSMYRARGGDRPVRCLVQTGVLRVVERMLRPSTGPIGRPIGPHLNEEDRAFLSGALQLFAPATVYQALDLFESLRMGGRSLSIESVMQLLQSFDRAVALCGDMCVPEDMVVRMFIAALRPDRLRQRVEARRPDTLERAQMLAVEETRVLLDILREAARVSPGPERSDRAPRPLPLPTPSVPPSRPAVQRVVGDAPPTLTCYGCGQRGHKKAECPQTKPGPKREGVTSDTPSPAPSPAGPPRPGWHRDATRLVRQADGGKAKVGQDQTRGLMPDGLVRVAVTLQGKDGGVRALALLDSGATRQYISSAVYRKLLEHGVLVRRTQATVQLLAGTVNAPTSVTCELMMEPQGGVGRCIRVSTDLLVVEGATEEVVIGMPLMTELGITAILVEDARVDATEAEFDQFDSDDDVTPPEEGCMLPAVELSGEDAHRVQRVLEAHSGVFGPLPARGAEVPALVIELKPGMIPAVQPPRRLSPALQETVKATVDEWLDLGIVQPSKSPYASPVVLVRKKDGSYRMCVDYRLLNKATVDMKFPLQNTRGILERMSGHAVFGTLDLRSGFHQVPLEEGARPLTAFSTPDGLFEFCRVQFGLKNGPTHFQLVMTQVLNGLLGNSCEVYIDDIIVYAHDMEEFCVRLDAVLSRLEEHSLRVNGVKCRLGLPAVEFLGHVVDGKGVSMSESRKQGLAGIKPPQSAVQLKSFLGLASYFRTFVKGFATVAKPLHRLCSEKVAFEWRDEAQQAFEALKAAMLEAPVLAHINYSLPLVLRTDASNHGVGGVLLQVVDGVEHPVSYVSKAFTPVEARWATIEQECFAVVFSIEALQHHLRGHAFVVETDHRNLLYLQKASSPKLIRWRLRLQEYAFEVRHVSGKSNVIADCLSRCLVGEDESPSETEDDEQGSADSGSESSGDDMETESEASVAAEGAGTPLSMFTAVHNSVLGHRGVALTLSLLREGGKEWPTMRADVEGFIKSCPVCQKVRLGQGSMAAALATTTVTAPFEVLAIDTVGPLPADAYGNEFIVVIIDCFSRFVELKATKTAKALDAAAALLEVFGRYGAPKMLRSDRGSQFTAAVIGNLLNLAGVGRHLTIPYRPQSNGLVERANKELGRHLRALVMDQRVAETWSMALPLVQRLLNSTPNRTIGTTPARVMFGGKVNLNRELLVTPEAPEDSDADSVESHETSTMEDYIVRLGDAQKAIVEAARQQQEAEIAEYLARTPEDPSEFADGSYVLVSYPDRPPTKLHPAWKGPMLVVEHSLSTYKCQDINDLTHHTFHVSRLKAYNPERTGDPLTVASVDVAEYVVDEIVEHRAGATKQECMFRVRWRGYEDSDDSWLPYGDLRDVAVLRAYLLAHPELDI